MANVVDKAILELDWNGKAFEEGARTSMKTLEMLQNSLNFDGASKVFDEIGDGASNVGGVFNKISTNIESLTNKFTAGGAAAFGFLSKAGEKAFDYVHKLVSNNLISGAIHQMQEGGMRRAANLEQAKFQLQGLNRTWEEVEPFISKAVDGTAFGLDEAAKVASQLVASGTELGDDMQDALSGISGVAAMTNSSYSEIGNIFTEISGKGKIMTEDLKQFAVRGLNVASELAKVYKTDEQTLREMVSNGEVDFKTFARAMNQAFGEQATRANETYDGALSNMKSALSRIGAEFATPYRDNMRQLFNAVRPQINSLKEIIMPFIKSFNEVEGKFFKFIVGIIEKLDLSPLNKVVELGINLLDILQAIGKRAMEVWEKVFPKKVKDNASMFSTVFSSFADKFKQFTTISDDVKAKFEAIVNPIKAIVEPVNNASEAIDEMANRVIRGDFGNDMDKRREQLEALGYSFERVQNRVNELLGCSFRYEVSQEDLAKANEEVAASNSEVFTSASLIEQVMSSIDPIMQGIASMFGLAADGAATLAVGLAPLGSVLSNIVGTAFTFVTTIANMITNMRTAMVEGGFFQKVADGLSSAFTVIANVLNPIIDGFRNFALAEFGVVQDLLNLIFNFNKFKKEGSFLSEAVGTMYAIFGKLGDILSAVHSWFVKLFDAIKNNPAINAFINAIKTLGKALVNLGLQVFINALKKVREWIGKIKIPNLDPKGFIDKIGEKLSGIIPFINEVTTTIGKLADGFKERGFGVFGEIIDNLKEKFKNFLNSLRDVPVIGTLVEQFENASTSINGFFDKIKDSGSIKSLGTSLTEVKEKGKEFYNRFKEDPLGTFKQWLTDAKTVIGEKFDKIKEVFKPFTDSIKEHFEPIAEYFKNLGLIESIKETFGSIKENISQFFDTFKEDPVGTIKTYFNKIVDYFKNAGDTLGEKVSTVFNDVKTAISDFIGNFDAKTSFQKLFDKLKEAVSKVDVSGLIKSIKEKLFGSMASASKAVNLKDLGASFNISEIIGKIFSSFNDIVGSVAEGINLEGIGKVIDKFPTWFKSLATGLLVFRSSGLVKAMKAVPKGIGKFFEGLMQVPEAAAGEIKNFGGIFTSVKSVIDGLKDVVGAVKTGLETMFGGLDKTMKAYRKHLAFKNLLYMAAAVGILAASIIALAQFPIDKIAAAGIIVVGLMTVLALIAKYTSEVQVGSIVGIGVLIAAFAAAMIAVTLVPTDVLMTSLVKLTGVMGTLAVLMIMMGQIAKTSLDKSTAVSLLAFSGAIAGITAAIALLTLLDPVKAALAVGAVAAIATIIAIFTKITNGADLGLSAGGVIGFVTAIDLLVPAIMLLAGIKEGLGQAIGAIGLITVIIGALTIFTNGVDMSATAGAMIGFAVALNLLMGVFLTSALLSPGTIAKGTIAIIAMSAAFFVLSKGLALLLPAIAALLAPLVALGALFAIVCLRFDDISAGFNKMWAAATSENGIITKVGNFFKGLTTGIKDFVKNTKTKIANLPLFKGMSDAWKKMQQAKASVGGLGDAFKGLIDKFKGWAGNFAPVKAAFDFLGGVKDKIVGAFSGVGDFFKNIFSGEGGGFLSTITSIPEKIHNFTDSLYNTFVKGTFVGDILSGVSNFASSIGDKIGNLFNSFKDGGGAALQQLIEGFTSDPLGAISSGIDKLKTLWLGDKEAGTKGVWGMIKDFAKPGVDAVKNLFEGFGSKIMDFLSDPIGNLKKWWLGEEGTENGGVWGMIKGFGAAGLDAVKNLWEGFTNGVSEFFKDPLGTLKSIWLGEEGNDSDGLWGMIKGFGSAGSKAVSNLWDGFTAGISEFFKDPLGTLKTLWIGEEGNDKDGIWGAISGFVDAGSKAVSNLWDGFTSGIAEFFKDPLADLKTWWLGEEGNDKDGVWGMIKGFTDAGAGALGKLIDGFIDGVSNFFKGPIETVKSWWLGEEGKDNGIWGKIKGFTEVGAGALGKLKDGFIDGVSNFFKGPIETVKSWWLGEEGGDEGVWGAVKGFASAGTTALKDLVAEWTDDPNSIVGKAVGAVKGLFVGSDGKGGIFSWASKIGEAGKSMVEKLAEHWNGDPGSIVTNAFNSVKSLFFGEGEGKTGGIFSWASDMLDAGKELIGNLTDGLKDPDKVSAITGAVTSIGTKLLYGDGTEAAPGSFSIMGAFNSLKKGAGDMLDNIRSAFEDSGPLEAAVNTVGNIISSGLAGAKSIFDAGVDFFKSLIRGFTGESESDKTNREVDEAIDNLASVVAQFSSRFEGAGAEFYTAISEAFNGDTETIRLALSTIGAAIEKMADYCKETKYLIRFQGAGSQMLRSVSLGFQEKGTVKDFETAVGTVIMSNGITKIASYKKTIISAGKGMLTWLTNGFASDEAKKPFEDTAGSLMTQSFLGKLATYQTTIKAAGKGLVDWLNDGFTAIEKIDLIVRSAGTLITQHLLGKIASYQDLIVRAGSGIVDWINDGISRSYRAIDGIYSMMRGIYNVASNYTDDFYGIGRDIDYGVSRGIYDHEWAITNAIDYVSTNAGVRMRNNLRIQSPSKVFAEIGKFVDKGFAEGLVKGTGIVTGSIENVANSAVLEMSKSVARMSALAQDTMDVQPTIRPVFDMTEIVDGFNRVGAMAANREYQVGLATADLIKADGLKLVNPNQNGLMMSIESLRSDLAKLNMAVSHMNEEGTTMEANIPIYLDGTQIGNRTADIAIKRINHIQANRMRVTGR